MRENVGAIDILMLMTPAINESIKNWLEIKTATSNLAINTRAAYRNDVIDFFSFLAEYQTKLPIYQVLKN
jgi:site-specific recombinase XerD